jgi:hypothetical protein
MTDAPLSLSWTTWQTLPRSARIAELLAESLVAAHELRAAMGRTSMAPDLELIIVEIEIGLRRLAS